MNIFNLYKENMKSIYSKQEELYISLENSSCDKYLINSFLLNYLKFIHYENKKLDNCNLFEYKDVIMSNIKRRDRILGDLTSNTTTDFCEKMLNSNQKLKKYLSNN